MSFQFKIVSFSHRGTPSTILKIDSFSQLEVGWHYGNGRPITGHVAETAKDICYFFIMVGLTRTNAFAGEGGEILIAAYHGKSYVSVMVEPDGSFQLVEEIAGTEREDFDFNSLSSVKSRILHTAKKICATSGSFTPGILTRSARSSMTWHSRSLPAGEGCPSY